MGFVAKANTKKLLAPRRFVTALDVVTANAIIHDLALQVPEKVGILTRGERYFSYYDGQWERLMIAYGNRSKKTGKIIPFWAMSYESRAASDGRSLMLTFEVVRWKTSDDSFEHQSQLKWFLRTVTERLSQSDPSFRAVTA